LTPANPASIFDAIWESPDRSGNRQTILP